MYQSTKRTLSKKTKQLARRSKWAHKVLRDSNNRRLQARFKLLTEGIVPNEKKVIFSSFMGVSYSDSPKAIYQAMLRDSYFDDWVFIWAFKKQQAKEFKCQRSLAKRMMALYEETKPESLQYIRAEVVVSGSSEYYRALAGSKYWITNSRLQDGVQPSSSHVFVQGWHGTPLKRLGADIAGGANALYSKDHLVQIYKQEANKWTYLLSPSAFYTEKMKAAFLLDDQSKTQIIQEGYPRNDALARSEIRDVRSMRRILDILDGKKVLLYTPTWRDNQHDYKKGYTYELGIDFDMLQKELGDEWVVLFRAHYFIANKFDFSKYDNFVYDVSKYPDINDLYIASDALMTDYSSVIFDYSILQRPILFFMYDYEDYARKVRGLYLSPNELPGRIFKTSKQIANTLKDIDVYSSEYADSLIEFKNRFCGQDDGYASERVVDSIFKKNI